MASEELLTAICHLVADVMQIPEASIRPQTTPADVPTWDSVQHLSLMLGVEDRFGVSVQPEEAADLLTPSAIADYIAAHLEKSAHT